MQEPNPSPIKRKRTIRLTPITVVNIIAICWLTAILTALILIILH